MIMGGLTSKQQELLRKEEPSTPTTVTGRPSKILPFDPRSPSENVSRTPIAVTETPDVKMADQSVARRTITSQILFDPRSPSTQQVTCTPIEVTSTRTKVPPFRPNQLGKLQNTPLTFDTDPRSPTDKVPRTPLEDKIKDEASQKKCNAENNSSMGKFSYEKDRVPLSVINKECVSLPAPEKTIGSHAVEEEFSENEKGIFQKLGRESSVKSDTAFIETI